MSTPPDLAQTISQTLAELRLKEEAGDNLLFQKTISEILAARAALRPLVAEDEPLPTFKAIPTP